MEEYHGRAVRLFPDNPHVPFYGAFLDHEMRARGCWSYLPDYGDRAISLPIQWQDWIVDASVEDGPDGGDNRNNGDGRHGNDYKGDGHEKEEGDDNDLSPTSGTMPQNKKPDRNYSQRPDRKPVRT